MTVGLLCGSVGTRSSNAALLSVAAERTAEHGYETKLITGLENVPFFDAARVDDAPRPVQQLRDQLRSCDALLLAAPEYAAGVAGSTKNALDWLVGDSTIYRKVIGVASAGTTGGPIAIEQLVRTISWQGGWVVATLGVSAPRTKADEHGTFTDAATIAEIRSWTDTVIDAVAGDAANRAVLLHEVVSRYDIDPARFGEID